MPSMRLVGNTAILDLGESENRQSITWMQQVNELLDQVLAGPASALVTTGSGKFYSNGLDVLEADGPIELGPEYVRLLQELYRRLLVLPMPTVAAVNGHAFGGGALLAMAHDFRVMRAERGFFCFPEVNIGIAFTPGMAALVQAKLTARQARDAMLTAQRFGGEQAVEAGLVDDAVASEQLLERAVELATANLPQHPRTLGTVKKIMYADAVTALALPHRPAGVLDKERAEHRT